MLVINSFLDKARARSGDDTGAVLVAVVVVMLLGFLVAVTIAGSVVFTIQANVGNRSSTQAFIAAESGRDAAVAQLGAAISSNGRTFTCSAGTLTGSGTNPTYTFTIYWTPSDTAPTSHLDAGLSSTCPTGEPGHVVINAVGTDAAGGRAEIDAVYPWDYKDEQQAGGVLAYFAGNVTSTVSNYTGDLVVRSGSYTCVNEGTINGDLYVTHGSVTLSRECTVNGSIWVRDNVDASSQRIEVTGEIRAGGDVTFTSNGTKLGATPAPAPPAPNGDILAGGDIDLTDTGSTNGLAYGILSATGAIDVGSKWTATGTRTPGAAAPEFNPTLDFIKSVTSWIDLDGASGWGVTPVSACSLSSADIVSMISNGSTDPIALDYQSCSSVDTDIVISGPSTVAVTKDVVFLAPAGKRMNLHIDTSLTGGKQLVFLHADASRALVSDETAPSCGNGNTKDTFDLDAGRDVTDVKIMVYSPCGLTGNIHASFTGQLYSNDSGNLSFGNGASYTCALMSWPDAFEKLGCKVRGSGDDVVVETVKVYKLLDRTYQTER
ncbi:hypothetical protein [Microbacterium hydrocarbonoxydans]|uniref:hypothetical protein n=1 Tax=Microbacterium hydrocarbonoxydans TaxID=273678 RepID=UPI0007BBD853|nr:hypothetical protein [Microbacterium hydrocarbonoxydans]GAT71639.1 hypothetical protein MHM582_0103 [Microbacterium sp. HM58-2]